MKYISTTNTGLISSRFAATDVSRCANRKYLIACASRDVVIGNGFCWIRRLCFTIVKLQLTRISVMKSVGFSVVVKYPGRRDLRTHPRLIHFMVSNEKDDLQDQITHNRGTASSYYGCCLHMRTPRNVSTGSKLLFVASKAVHGRPEGQCEQSKM